MKGLISNNYRADVLVDLETPGPFMSAGLSMLVYKQASQIPHKVRDKFSLECSSNVFASPHN